MFQSKPASSSQQFPFASPAAMTPFTMQQNAQSNVVVVKTDGYDYEGSTGNYFENNYYLNSKAYINLT